MKALIDFVLRLSTRRPIARWSPIPLRLIVGYGFMQHGFAKLSKGPDMFAAILQGMGVPAPHVMAWLTILTELLGGFAVLLGAFVTVVSVPMTAVLLVAMFKVHLQYGFSSIKLLSVTATGAKFGPVGYEVILLYIAPASPPSLSEVPAHSRSMDSSSSASKRKQASAGSLQLLGGNEVGWLRLSVTRILMVGATGLEPVTSCV